MNLITFFIVSIVAVILPNDVWAVPVIRNYSNVTVNAAATDASVPKNTIHEPIHEESPPVVPTTTNRIVTNEIQNDATTNSSLTAVKRSKKSNDDMMASASEACAVSAPCSVAAADQTAASSGSRTKDQQQERVSSAYGFGGHTHSTGFGSHHRSAPTYQQYGNAAEYQSAHQAYQGPAPDSYHQHQAPPAYQQAPPTYHQQAPSAPSTYEGAYQSHQSYPEPSHQSYEKPSYSPANYEAPSAYHGGAQHQEYEVVPHHQPHHHEHAQHYEAPSSYHESAPAYHQSYQPAAPAYHQSYSQPPPPPAYMPAYPAIAYPAYPPMVYPAPSYYGIPPPTISYSYPSPAPQTQCGSNVLVGCSPTVSSVPCGGYNRQPYDGGSSSYRAAADNEDMGAANPNLKKSDDISTEKPSSKFNTTTESSSVSGDSKQRNLKATQDKTQSNTIDTKTANSGTTTTELNAADKEKSTAEKMSQLAYMLKKNEGSTNDPMSKPPGLPHNHPGNHNTNSMPSASNLQYAYYPIQQPQQSYGYNK